MSEGKISFFIKDIKCTNLVNLEGEGDAIDPYVSFKYQDDSKKTETREKELNPSFRDVIEFSLKGKELGPEDYVEIKVKDHEMIGSNRLVGKATVSLQPLLNSSSGTETFSATLTDKNGMPTTGKITFRAEYNGARNNSGSGGESENTNDGELDEENEEDGEEGDTLADVTGPNSGSGNSGSSAKKPTVYKRKARRKVELPDKPTDFQIRIKIIEGRQLPGVNINPTVRVLLGDETKQTRVKRSTNKPFFDETFFFNFNERPNKLFDELITFEVMNARGLLSDATLGTFHCDVGTIYDADNHAIVRKWLLMTAPEETGKSEGDNSESKGVTARPGGPPAGYIKITAFILGPGDQIPEIVKSGGNAEEEEDIESNLLRPAGSSLGTATFFVRIFQAEDIPQMDSSSFDGIKKLWQGPTKDHVDPYAKFSFAGQTNKTCTKYENNHPEFNEELRVSYQFPSMCERLQIRMYDWDRVGKDDVIGTNFISLSSISGTGEEGFLPCFGPSYINFYGSTREFSNLPDKYDKLNKGVGEGCGYRGRALIEIRSKLGKHVDKRVQSIPENEVMNVQLFMRRRKFKLFATFTSANMISETDAPIEFEISIGNYGNKLDPDLEPQSSSTPPTMPVFDGCSYYFLPWQSTKPCCMVESHWENIIFRLEPLNILLKITEKLKDGIEKVKISIKSKAQPSETAALLISLLDEFIKDCQNPLPEYDSTKYAMNELDYKLQSVRKFELESLTKDATTLREQATDISEAMEMIEGFVNRVKELCNEPQNSMPDVVLWMISGDKRIAYYRIPANEILFSKNETAKGKNCSKLQNIILRYPSVTEDIDDDKMLKMPACVSVMLWLGLEAQQGDWADNNKMEGEYSVYAETYENQGKPPLLDWTPKVVSRPEFSDAAGKIKLKKSSFIPPNGWKWDDPPNNQWFIDPEINSNFEADAGHKKFMQDVYENESRIPGGNWGKSDPYYTDIKGDEVEDRDETEIPEGWRWVDDWVVDNNRACDEEGWQYTVAIGNDGWSPVPRRYHLFRRRRWVRNRILEQDPKKLLKNKKEQAKLGEGWEYAPTFGKTYHLKERRFDFVRRRRWHRKMVNTKPGCVPLFTFAEKSDKVHYIMPRIFLAYDNAHKYQMRAYIYQARDILGLDSEGTSDAYAKVCFQEQSQMTRVVKETLCPDFDETLIFDDMQLFGSPELLAENPPYVAIEFFDKDKVGKDEFLGRCLAKPIVKLNGSKPPVARLKWYPITRGNKDYGEMLAAFELFLDEGGDLPLPPPTKNNRFIVPNGIRPIMTKTAVEVLAWGVRNMKKFQLANCSSPSAVFEIGSYVIETDVIKNTKRNPNFTKNIFYKEMFLPKDPLYMPPILVKVIDHRTFGRKPVVGRHVIKSIEMVTAPKKEYSLTKEAKEAKPQDQTIDIEDEETPKKKKKIPVDDSLDWWSKFFASVGEDDKCGSYKEKGYSLMKIYNNELEEQKEFRGFGDFIQSYPLERGKEDSDDEEDNIVGEFKGLIKMYHLPIEKKESNEARYFTKKTQEKSRPVDCLVRVYIIRGRDFQPKDPNGKADPYVTIELGKKKLSNKDNYVPNNINPLFGAFFELKATIPLNKDLKIRVMDYDFGSRNDLIGETVIDLENRYLSQCRATVGLPGEYFAEGPYKWRDVKTPREILDDISKVKPQWMSKDQVIVNGELFSLDDFESSVKKDDPLLGEADQRLALHILNNQQINGYTLVPEHVESRILRNPVQPSMNQGQLDMFVDIFPLKDGVPGPPLDIAPRKPHEYELRVIIWNTADVPPTETSITGDEMSDLYIKGWMGGTKDDKQKTDVHYRSMDGEGMFNWRMVFPFKYMPEEKLMVVETKDHFWSLDKTIMKMPPTFSVQVWDNDLFMPEEFIGIRELDLSRLVKPKKDASGCDMKTDDVMDLFQAKSARGWWMMIGESDEGEKVPKGKVEMTLEVVGGEEASMQPVGKGREEPNTNPPLDKPQRPETSFLWFTSPLKTLKYIIWRKYKWHLLIGLILLILIIFIVLLFYYFPGGLINKMFGRQ